MKLIELLEDVKIAYNSVDLYVDVKDVTDDIKKVKSGSLFFCIKGTCFDGHANAAEALKNGAIGIVVGRDLNLSNQIIAIGDTKDAYSSAIEKMFGNPSKELCMVGVTGTNGKTSVVSITQFLFEKANIASGIIGTMYSKFREMQITSKLTTPDCYTLNDILCKMKQSQCKVVCMEVSSHALDQRRIGHIAFDVAVFTNLTQDHLDYHVDMESYFQCKKKLFAICKVAVVNIDDPYGKRLNEELVQSKLRTLTYSTQDPNADYYADGIVYSSDKVEFILHHNSVSARVSFPMPGKFSVYNALAAIATAHYNGIRLGLIVRVLSDFTGVSGRTQVIYSNKEYSIIRDYAHTPDGLFNILRAVKDYCKGDIILVFGCGGDRDCSKRALMAKMAGENADIVIVTSDNPRHEDPQEIIDHIVMGFEDEYPYKREVDRKKAIQYAMKIAKKDDIIVLAGKGHETYQIIGDTYYDFDEQKIVEELTN